MSNQEKFTGSHPEAPAPREKYSNAQLFEHLFPGNFYKDLPLVTFNTARLIPELYLNKRGFRDLRLELSATLGKLFVEREELPELDRMLIRYYIGGLTPYNKIGHPTMFRNHLFSEHVDVRKGEKLGGSALRDARAQWSLAERIGERFGLSPYVDYQTEYILGVLDKDDHPCAIIYFGEGEHPSQGGRGKKIPLLAPTLAPMPIRIND